MADKILGSYLYELKPYINTSDWRKASGEIDKALKSSKISYDEWGNKKKEYAATVKEAERVKSQLEIIKQQIKNTTNEAELAVLRRLRGAAPDEEHEGTGLEGDLRTLIEKLNLQKADLMSSSQMVGILSKISGGLSKFASSMAAAYGSAMTFVETMKKAINSSLELANKAAGMANKLNAFGGFGSMGTRDVMARYGISATQANAMTAALNQMGLSESDIGRMTESQRRVYDNLIQHFQEGVDRIDSRKLDEYYKTMEEFQLAQAQWKMDIQNTILKIFAESDSFRRLTGSLVNFFERSIQFLESPAVQWFFDVFIEFLSSLVDFASWFLGSFGTGGNQNNTTNNNNNSRNNYYIYGSGYANNNELARSIALETTGGGIG